MARQSETLDSRTIDTRPVAHRRDACLPRYLQHFISLESGPLSNQFYRTSEAKAIPQHRFEQIPKNSLRQPRTSADPMLQGKSSVASKFSKYEDY